MCEEWWERRTGRPLSTEDGGYETIDEDNDDYIDYGNNNKDNDDENIDEG